MSVTITSAVKNNLLSLQSISSEAAKIQNVLATGKKVNTALDNATSFFTSQSLNSRASSLSSLLDPISNGIQTIQAANSGISSITKLVDQLKSTAQQALQTSSAYTSKAALSSNAITGATSVDIRGANSAAAAAVGTSAGTVTTSTVLNASSGGLTTPFAANDTISVNGTTITVTAAGTGAQDDTHVRADDTVGDLLGKIATAAGNGATATVASNAITVTAGDKNTNIVLGGSAITKLGLTAGTTKPTPPALDGKKLTFAIGSDSLTVTLGDPASRPGSIKSLDDLNSKLSTIGLSASLDSTGALNFTTTADTASQSFTVKSGDSATATATGFGSSTASASTGPTRGGAGADSRDALVTQYNGLLDQINTLAKDASFNGLNLLTGDTLSLVFNETNSSKLSITGQDASFTGLGLSKVSASNFNDGDGINTVLSTLEGSKTSLASLSAKLGANLAVVQTRQDFTKNIANTLTTGADNLVNADTNEEATKLLALQTSQSLAQSALSLANQSAQGVLRLLQ